MSIMHLTAIGAKDQTVATLLTCEAFMGDKLVIDSCFKASRDIWSACSETHELYYRDFIDLPAAESYIHSKPEDIVDTFSPLHKTICGQNFIFAESMPDKMADSVRVYYEPNTGDFLLEDEIDLNFDLLVYLYIGNSGTEYKIVQSYAPNTLQLLAKKQGAKYTLALYQCREFSGYYLHESSCYSGDLGDVTRLESDIVMQSGDDFLIELED
jgi:hypothetical protein